MNESAFVLVVDDEKPIRDFVRRNLDVRGFRTLTASNGLEALVAVSGQKIDLVILDMMMPHLDGLETIRRIRQKSTVPIIVLTALGEEEDKIKAFDLGADDYLTKPFGIGELLVRVKAVLRRAHWNDTAQDEGNLSKGDILVDLVKHKVFVRKAEIELTPTEFNLLVYLIKNSGKILSHRSILQHIWGPEYGEESEYLRVYMGKLRQKIEEDPLHPKYIQTERGVGYWFEE